MFDNGVMEVDIPMENVQDGDGDDGTCQVITDCLGLPEILRKIMQCFSTTELLELSVVNKQWNYEARSLMNSRGNLIARLDEGGTCQVLEEFAWYLQDMKQLGKVEPFSGLSIALGDWNGRRWCVNSSSRELIQVYKDILNQVTWKHLSLKFSPRWEKHKRCPPFRLVKKILHMYSGGLEELSLLLESRQREDIQQVFQNRRFPHLKTLRFMDSNYTSGMEDYTNMIKALVSIAPSLQVLYTEDRVNLSANLLEGSSAIHVTNHPLYVVRDEIPESLISQLRLQRLELTSMLRYSNLQRFNRITSALLDSSRSTLSWMSIEMMFLIPLMCYGIRLENLKKLEINLQYSLLERCQPRILRLVKYFDFPRIFPNLSTISINSTRDNFRNFQPIANAINVMVHEGDPAFESVPDRAVNIKNLHFEWHALFQLYPSIPLLAEMFPDIQKLSVETHDIPFAGIWDSWLDLKELKVILSRSPVLELNLDSALCGLFPEEVAELREKDDEYLKAVNIVPVMPSIACFKGLRTFNLVCDIRRPYYDSSYLLSKVTGLIAFKRCPGLTVTVATNNKELEQALSSMKPYASIVAFELFGIGP